MCEIVCGPINGRTSNSVSFVLELFFSFLFRVDVDDFGEHGRRQSALRVPDTFRSAVNALALTKNCRNKAAANRTQIKHVNATHLNRLFVTRGAFRCECISAPQRLGRLSLWAARQFTFAFSLAFCSVLRSR